MTSPYYYYVLDGKTPVPVADSTTWAKAYENFTGRRVARTTIGDVVVSTVFLGLDHRIGDGPPQLFETLIFGGEHADWMERCATWAEAEAQHEKACALVRARLP